MDLEKYTLVRKRLPPTKSLQAMYTFPAGIFCVTVPQGEPGSGTVMVQTAVPRGISTATHGLSKNCPALPLSNTAVPMYRIGSVLVLIVVVVAFPFSLLFRSTNLEIKTTPIFWLRLKAMPL